MTACSSSVVQDAAYLYRQVLIGKGFQDQFNAWIQASMVHNGIARIAAHEQHLETGLSPLCFFGELPAVHAARQTNVGKKQVDFAMRVEQPKTTGPIRRFNYPVTELAKHIDGKATNISFIFDHQNGLSASCGNGHGSGPCFIETRGREIAGQIKLDRGTCAYLAVNLDVSARLFDEAVNLREAEPGTLTDFFGCEERLKGFGDYFRRHADARCR